MLITLSPKPQVREHLVLPIFDKELIATHKALSEKERAFVAAIIASEELSGEFARVFRVDAKSRSVVLIGMGKSADVSEKKLRIFFRRAVRELKTSKIKRADIALVPLAGITTLVRLAEIAAMELIIADFVFNKYKETPKKGWPSISALRLAIPHKPDEKSRITTAIRAGMIIGTETNAARNLANTPGGDMTPTMLAKEAMNTAAQIPGLTCKVLGETDIELLGMGALSGVARGSTEPPQFIILEYRPETYSGKPLILVGKGITFDTGGLNLKPNSSILDMHLDMSGGAAVIHALSAIAKLKIPLHVVGLVPAAENMPSGSSFRPGDILKAMNGKTIEVLNTDAEGRLVLADALAYAKKFDPLFVVDIATLTGAAMVAVGTRLSALFTEKSEDEATLRRLGDESGDYLWPLPLAEEYLEDLRGTFADLANIWKNNYGGAIEGAVFLKQFVDYPWAHIDMAPTMTTVESDKLAKGAKGTGVRLFVELARHFATKQ
ncbi:MAG: leucyl aminopeptidase [Patescibacteria group bacterium]